MDKEEISTALMAAKNALIFICDGLPMFGMTDNVSQEDKVDMTKACVFAIDVAREILNVSNNLQIVKAVSLVKSRNCQYPELSQNNP